MFHIMVLSTLLFGANHEKIITHTSWVQVCGTSLTPGTFHFSIYGSQFAIMSTRTVFHMMVLFFRVSVFLCITKKLSQCQVCVTSLHAEISHFSNTQYHIKHFSRFGVNISIPGCALVVL